MKYGAATVENMECPQNIRNGISFDPAIPGLGIQPKDYETPKQKKYAPLCL